MVLNSGALRRLVNNGTQRVGPNQFRWIDCGAVGQPGIGSVSYVNHFVQRHKCTHVNWNNSRHRVEYAVWVLG